MLNCFLVRHTNCFRSFGYSIIYMQYLWRTNICKRKINNYNILKHSLNRDVVCGVLIKREHAHIYTHRMYIEGVMLEWQQNVNIKIKKEKKINYSSISKREKTPWGMFLYFFLWDERYTSAVIKIFLSIVIYIYIYNNIYE